MEHARSLWAKGASAAMTWHPLLLKANLLLIVRPPSLLAQYGRPREWAGWEAGRASGEF